MKVNNRNFSRRQWLGFALGTAGLASTPGLLWADDDSDLYEGADDDHHYGSGSSSGNAVEQIASSGPTGSVVVVGGGMAGATVAKYLRLWGGAAVQVTLVEPDASYTSNIMSNLVLNGAMTTAQLAYTHDSLVSRYGVVRRSARVTGLDAANRQLSLSDGTALSYDRLVLAPGVEFMPAYGLTVSDYETKTPHAWRAGAQTDLLKAQIDAMVDGDTFVMTIPLAPYRCPPGPYERACLVADTLKNTGRSRCKVVVLDENAGIQAEKENFAHAFDVIHQGIIDYRPGVSGIQIDPDTKVVRYDNGASVINAAVVSPIPPHRAAGIGAGALDEVDNGGWLAKAGLNNSAADAASPNFGRWAVVNVLSYESTAVPKVHVIGDAASCGLPKAGHVGNQEAKICADAIVRLLGGGQPDPAPVANSACYSPITRSTASWLTAVYQYDANNTKMMVAANGGSTVGAGAVEAASISTRNYNQMFTWFHTLMGDSFA
jgi:NADPH-dependent 2,4-dienoyl-CoA reductase/sulfur reductase-like enzyme